MAPVQNGTVIYKEPPSGMETYALRRPLLSTNQQCDTGYPVPGKTVVYDDSQTIDLDNAPLDGGVLIKILVLSIDPYLRHKMQPENPLHAIVCPVLWFARVSELTE